MNKTMKYYITTWVGFIALFNLVCFITPSTIGGVEKIDNGFWMCYGIVIISFMAHLGFTWYVTSSDKDRPQKSSMLTVSSLELALMIICGLVCIFVPSIPDWAGVIACAAVLIFSIIFVLSTGKVNESLEAANVNLNAKTSRIRQLTDEAALLEKYARDESSKAIAMKVYEALRYSDPVSASDVIELEEAIEQKLTQLSRLLSSGDASLESLADELLILIDRRNMENKAIKRMG